jgi:hypothetical protein
MDTGGTDDSENITLELELEHEVPPPSNDTSQNPSHFQKLSVEPDNDFLYAYEHGIVILCLDGISRHFYPRIFTYSADYPEE